MTIMLKLISPAIRLFFRVLLYKRYSQYIKLLDNPEAAQDKALNSILALYNSSPYGRNNGHAKDYNEFKKNVPIVNYDDLHEHILKMKKKGSNHFTPGPVLFYEPTSGSSGKKKLIPYTWALKSSFSKMFSIWAYDLITNGPKLSYGKFYFSVSPQFKSINEGLEDDTEYLDGFLSWFLKPFFVTPKKIKRLKDPLAFKKVLALHLMAEEKLEIISVWNPSSFTILLDFISENRQELLLDLEKGFTQHEGLTFKLKKPSQKRIEVIRHAPLTDFWPELKLISSWGCMEAEQGFTKLKKVFPSVYIQAKGLLATEAPLTIPLIKAHGFAPLSNSIFFEFESENQNIYRLHELRGGQTYNLIITTPGGLYRYRLGDKVKVAKHFRETPCLDFLGRGSGTTDLFGEKMNSIYLKSVVDKLNSNNYYTFYPTRIDEDHGYYILLTDDNSSGLEETAEAALMEAFHYQVARKLGSLKALKVVYHQNMNERVLDYFQKEKGMKLGDIKPSLLIQDFNQSYLKDIS